MIWRSLGKGPGFFVVAETATLGLLVLAALGADVAALTAPLGVVCGAYYGGGAWKAQAEAKNGSPKP